MRVLLTGAGGMLASSVARAWVSIRPNDELVAVARHEVDLRDHTATYKRFEEARPDLVVHTAAFVGGIHDKLNRPLPYLIENMRIDTSVLDAAVSLGVSRLIYIGSAAAYPASTPSPISEEALFSGPLEPANETYGLAKLSGITAVRYAAKQTGFTYRALMPSNLYGPHDNFDPARSHLVAAAIYKMRQAVALNRPSVEVWGDGLSRREFTFAPDIAHWVAESVDSLEGWPEIMNVGAGEDHTIREFYRMAGEIAGFRGELTFDPERPSGVKRRLMDSSKARENGWVPRTSLRDGMTECYESFLSRIPNERFA